MAPHRRAPMARHNPRPLGTIYNSVEVGVDWAADARRKGEQIAMLKQKVLKQEAAILSMTQIIADAVDDLKGETLDSLIYYRRQAEILEERLSSLQPIPPSPRFVNGQALWLDEDMVDTPAYMTPRAPTVSPLTPPPQGMVFPPIAPLVTPPGASPVTLPVVPPIASSVAPSIPSPRRKRQKRVKGQEPELKAIARKCKVGKNYKV